MMLVYPNGDTLYWLEGYPNDFGDTRDKKVVVTEADMNEARSMYRDTAGADSMASGIEAAMEILGSGYRRIRL